MEDIWYYSNKGIKNWRVARRVWHLLIPDLQDYSFVEDQIRDVGRIILFKEHYTRTFRSYD